MRLLKKNKPGLLPVSSVSSSTSQSSKTAESITQSSFDKPPSYERSNSSINTTAPPILRQSSSSVLRSKSSQAPQKKKNVPYRPSTEQQMYIDKLGSSSVQKLSVSSSSARTEYFDVLPSFQMFQSILKRDDDQFNENLLIQPPDYGDTRNSSPTPPNLSPFNSNSSQGRDAIDELLSPTESGTYNHDEQYAFDDNEDNEGLQNNNQEYYSRQNISSATDTYGHTILDNIDRLPKLNTSPIDIQIYVTKLVPEPHQENEVETRLKEYSSGDLVNGYILIHNTSDAPVSFGLFTVSLEGTIKATEKSLHDDPLRKYSKVLMKKFLKMYDLNASYGYVPVPNSAGIEYEAFTIDQHDGCCLGLPNERILQPHTKYKKFFTFKFPSKLLDTSCSSNILPHLLPPPSSGIDRDAFNGKTERVELNKALGYGCLNDRGTPLLTRDYGFDDMCISYTIEAKFIDKVNSSQADPVSPSDIDDTDNLKKYVVSRGSQYFLRFIPDLKYLIQYYNEELMNGTETFGSIGIDGKLFNNYIYTSTWRAINQLNTSIEEEISSRLDQEEYSNEDLKHKNLILDNQKNTRYRLQSILAKEQVVSEENYNEETFYRNRRMIGSRFPTTVFGKKKKKILTSLVKLGHLKIYVEVLKQPLKYASPKLITRYNMTENYDPRVTELMPVNSISSNHINELYWRVDDDYSRNVNISLVFDALEPGITPPGIASIECNIVSWSFRADYPLPCKFEYDFFYETLDDVSKKASQVDITKANLQHVKDQTINYIHFLKANKTFISKDSYLYLKSMKTLGIKCDTISQYFKPLTPATHPELFQDDWKAKSPTSFTKDLTIPLEVVNKHNINLIPNFQSCLLGRLYCLQVVVKYKGAAGEKNEFADNVVSADVPILVG